MAVQTLTKRTVIFYKVPIDFDWTAVLNDSGVQTAAGFSAGGAVQHTFTEHHVFAAGAYTHPFAFEMIFLVTAANDALIVGGIPALQTRFPLYPLTTWAETIQFGI